MIKKINYKKIKRGLNPFLFFSLYTHVTRQIRYTSYSLHVVFVTRRIRYTSYSLHVVFA